jgi:uncharacterized protein DUF6687
MRRMRYSPYDELQGRPNIVVDGYPAAGTVLTLSHWRGSGSPEELAADLSTQIAFRYLDRPDLRVDAELVSNNHFDEDGLCGIYAVLNPSEALVRRALLEDVASAGDFGTFRDRTAARIAFALGAYADEDRSPLGAEVFAAPYPKQSAALYNELLVRLPEMLDAPDRFRALWDEADARLERDEERVRSGAIRIEERPEIDLAIVTVPEGPENDEDPGTVEGGEWSGGCHPFAIHNATERHRVLIVSGRRYLLRFRYETWVRYISRPTMPRVDLTPLAATLTERETVGRWTFDDIENITPSLHLSGADSSEVPPEDFVNAVAGFLGAA